MTNKSIIFHYPMYLDPKAKKASGIRPRKMMQAFRDIGYQVEEVTGFGSERKKKIGEVIKKIRKGVKYAFVYSESFTMPNALTDNHHLPLHPFIDSNLFQACNKANIPIGLFYRDIYWLFPEYKKSLSFLKYTFAKLFFKLDLHLYEKYVSKIYLPSIRMKSYIPIVSEHKFDELPPAHNNTKAHSEPVSDERIKMLYVGGIGPHYQMHHLLKVASDLDFVTLTLCTREDEWFKAKREYESFWGRYPENIKIIHKRGDELKIHFNNADVFMVYVLPKAYWSFAVPVKLYEYIGEGKPIIATRETLAGEIVNNYNLGWSIPYNDTALSDLLFQLKNQKKLITEKAEQVRLFAKSQTWIERAVKVAEDMLKIKNEFSS